MPLSTTPIPECPRCGYDQSGIVAAWTEACPLTGTCSECGLSFSWRDVLDSRFFGPHWSFEHAARPRLRQLWSTAWRTLAPWIIWRRLGLPHKVRPLRLARFAALVLLLGLHLPAIALIGYLQGSIVWANDPGTHLFRVILWPYGELFEVGRMYFEPFMTAFVMIAFIPAICMPLTMLVFGQTFRQAKVRRAHLARGLVYSLPTAIAGTWILATSFYVVIFLLPPPPRGVSVETVLAVEAAALLIWLGAWWGLFVSRYLRLPHSLIAGVSLVIIAGLATAIVFLLTHLIGR